MLRISASCKSGTMLLGEGNEAEAAAEKGDSEARTSDVATTFRLGAAATDDDACDDSEELEPDVFIAETGVCIIADALRTARDLSSMSSAALFSLASSPVIGAAGYR